MTNPRFSNAKHDKYPKTYTYKHVIFKLQKIKNKETILKKTKGDKEILPRGIVIRIILDFYLETIKTIQI